MQRSIAVLLVSLVLVGAALGASDERWATSEYVNKLITLCLLLTMPPDTWRSTPRSSD